MHRKACCPECARILIEEVSTRVVVLYVVRALVSVAVVADGICLRLLEVSGQRPVLIEIPSYVEEQNSSACRLFEGPLAYRARCQGSDFEFQPISVPLIERLK